MEQLSSHLTDFCEILFLNTSRISVEGLRALLKLARITGTLREDVRKFMTISHLIFLRMRNRSDKICRENQNTHYMLKYSPPKIVPFVRYVVKADGPQMII
jgi:hypothetical protein